MAPQTESRQEGGVQRKAVSLMKHGISGTNRYVIKKLEAELNARKAKYEEVERVNHELRAKEQVLLESVAAQGNTLHFVALAAFQEPDATTDPESTMSGMAQSLLQDLQVHQLLSMVGNRSASEDEPYTTRCMRAAFTPQRVAAVRAMTLEQVVQELQSMTMKMAVLLQSCAAEEPEGEDSTMGDDGNGAAAPVLRYTIDSMVDEYTELAMLLHVASDNVNLQLGTINLDTIQQQEPPAGHWQRVLGHLQLQPEQISHVCAGFQVYAEKVAPFVAQTHELVRLMHATTGSLLPELQRSTLVDADATNSALTNANMNNNNNNNNNNDNNVHGIAAATMPMGSSSSSSMLCNGGSSSSARMIGSPGLGPGSVPRSGLAAAAAAAAASGMVDPACRSSSSEGVTAEDSSRGAGLMQHRSSAAGHDTAAGAAAGLMQHWSSDASQNPAAAAAAAGVGVSGMGSPDFGDSSGSVKPWQQFGIAEEGLTVEDAVRLDQLLKELLANMMRLRELHRGMTFLWLNTLTKRQKAISIVKAYPFWTQPLAMCKILLEQQQQQRLSKQQQQQRSSKQQQQQQQASQQQHVSRQCQQQQGSIHGRAMQCSP